MPTVIDSFILEFNLDPRQFTAGQRQLLAQMAALNAQALATANQVESSTKKTFNLLNDLRREALTTFAIIFGGREVGQMVEHITKLDAATGRYARTLGISTEELSQWQGAIRQVGGSVESANSAFGAMNAQLQRYKLTGQASNEFLGIFSQLGLDPSRLTTPAQAFLAIAQGIERQRISAQDAASLMGMMGINEDMINLILKGTKALGQFLDASREAGTTTGMSASQAAEYQRQLALLDQTTTNLGRNLLSNLLPAITAVTGAIAKLVASWSNQPTPGTPADEAAQHSQRERLLRRFGDPRKILNDLNLGFFSQFFGTGAGDYAYDENGNLRGITPRAPYPERFGGDESNMARFLAGLSFLETDQRNIGNPTSSAQGYFQFLSGTAAKARAAGIPDPRSGDYAQQAAATSSFIRHFYPEAGLAIDRGDYASAIERLRGEWPSLPGGSQAQSPGRYSQFSKYLQGGSRGLGGGTTFNMRFGDINVNGDNANQVANGFADALKRHGMAGLAATGAQ